MPWFCAPRVTAASPGQHAGPRLDARAEVTDRPDELERGSDRALGVVLERRGRAPDGHHRVADELLDRAAVAGDDRGREVEIARQGLADVLGITLLRERREPDEIREQHRDEAAFRDGLSRGAEGGHTGRVHTVARGRGVARAARAADAGCSTCRGAIESRAAGPAEALARRVGRPAARAAGRERRATVAAEPLIGLRGGATRVTGQEGHSGKC